MSQNTINDYFLNHWLPKSSLSRFETYEFSGLKILEKIGADDKVLDVGCGKNFFKGKIKNLYGIDPVSHYADEVVSIEDFVTRKKFDVALCLGSINFGSRNNIISQIAKVTGLLNQKAKIFWRCNPGAHDHGSDEFKSIEVYNWTFDDHYEFAEMFGFMVTDMKPDSNNRIYAEWFRT